MTTRTATEGPLRAAPEQRRPRSSQGPAADPDPLRELKESLRRLLATLLERAVGLAPDKVEQLARPLDEMAARGGPELGALFGGARAALSGGNPVWGAIRGAVSAAKVALVAALSWRSCCCP